MHRSSSLLKQIALVVVVGVWLWLFPPRWWLNLIKPVDLANPVTAGETLVSKYECRKCHVIGEEGNPLRAPNLNKVTERYDPISLRIWLRDPRSTKWKTLMPNFNLSDPEIEAIVSYLKSLNHLSD